MEPEPEPEPEVGGYETSEEGAALEALVGEQCIDGLLSDLEQCDGARASAASSASAQLAPEGDDDGSASSPSATCSSAGQTRRR